MTTKLKFLTFLTGGLLVLDQASKVWTVQALRYSGPPLPPPDKLSIHGPMEGLTALGHSLSSPREIELIPGLLSFIHAQNPGAAGGMFNNFEFRLMVFYTFTAIAVGVLLNMYKQLADDDRFQSATIALILSGALGNFIDRVHKSTVTDFVRVYTENPSIVAWLRDKGLPPEYPTWNVADACIVVGVAMYLIQYLIFERDKDIKVTGDNPLDRESDSSKAT